jgi:hypothetical protein
MCSAPIVYPVLDEPSFPSAAHVVSLSRGKMNNSGRALSLRKGAEAFRLFHIVPIQTMRLITQTATGNESHIHWTLKNTVLLYTFPVATSGELGPLSGIDASRTVLVLDFEVSREIRPS